jgi:hypothetical protein
MPACPAWRCGVAGRGLLWPIVGALMQVQRWKLRRQMPWFAQAERIAFLILAPLAALLFVFALVGLGTGAAPWLAFIMVSLVAAQSLWMWRYIAGAPIGDEPPISMDDAKTAALAAYRRQWVYAALLVATGLTGTALAVIVNPLHLLWGLPCLLLGTVLALALHRVLRPRMTRLSGDRHRP